MQSILTVNHLSTEIVIHRKKYALVEDVSFQLHRGRTLALLGESGSGKTLTALSIMRILSPPLLPSRGEVLFNGKNWLTISEKEMRSIRGAKIGMIFQDPTTALNPVYTIGSQLMEVVHLHLQLYDEEAKKKVIQALDAVGIALPESRFQEYPHQLSGGMKQRVMIAMALLCRPDILIADEPTTALDVTIQDQVLELIKNLQKELGMALLLITHDMGVVAEMADEVIVMYASQTIERGNVYDIFDRMAHPYTKGLFECRPDVSSKKQLKPIKGSVPFVTHYPSGCRFHPRCPYVMEKCRQGIVPQFLIDEKSQHTAKCWLHDGTEESQNKLKLYRA